MQVIAGWYHSIGLQEDGFAVAWGENYSSQCDVPAGETFVQVAAGSSFSIGLRGLPVIACCVPSDCFMISDTSCDTIGGSWIPSGNCEDCPPAELIGACCVTLGCDVITKASCTQMGGTWIEAKGGTCDDCATSCAADLDGDGEVKVADLLLLIAAWGACP